MSGRESYPTLNRPTISMGAVNLYERLTRDAQPQPADRDALTELLALGLVREDTADHYTPVDPSYADASWTAAYYSNARLSLNSAAHVTDTLAPLRHAYDTRPTGRAGVIEYLRGTDSINARLGPLFATCVRELLVCQPGGPRKQELLNKTTALELEIARRGVAIRTIYEESARADAATGSWVETMRRAGVETRTLAWEFPRTIIIDRRVAVIPGSAKDSEPHETLAHLINDSAVAGYLADSFDRTWDRAAPWTREASPGDLTDRQKIILQALSRGDTQEVITRRLGLSKRNMVKEIAALKDRFRAETLFQLACRWMEPRA